MNIQGYLVLRKPNFNFDDLGRGAFLSAAPRIDDLYYGGVDRMQWFDLDEGFYSKSLPARLVDLREGILKAKPPSCDFSLCQDKEIAMEILEFSNKDKHRNELVAIYCEDFCKDFQEVRSKVTPLGCDLYCDGYGSILKEGVFCKPELFEHFIPRLNDFGVFDDVDGQIEEYIRLYRSIAKKDLVEDVAGRIKKIMIYRVVR